MEPSQNVSGPLQATATADKATKNMQRFTFDVPDNGPLTLTGNLYIPHYFFRQLGSPTKLLVTVSPTLSQEVKANGT